MQRVDPAAECLHAAVEGSKGHCQPSRVCSFQRVNDKDLGSQPACIPQKTRIGSLPAHFKLSSLESAVPGVRQVAQLHHLMRLRREVRSWKLDFVTLVLSALS